MGLGRRGPCEPIDTDIQSGDLEMSEHIASSADTLSRAREVRTEVLGPERCTLITPDHPLPTISRQSGAAEPRFELFHYVFSVCSQKVRGTLAEKAITYGSNEVGILPPHNDNYRPQYVRLRLMAEAATKQKRISAFTGQTSVESEGFDPLVVPTFVDHKRSLVMADSKAICLHICATETTGTDLIPRGMEEQIASQLAIVDSTPHVALLYGADPDGDRRPASVRTKMPGIHKHKIEAVQRNMQLAGGDAELLAAYRQKIAKEQAAAGFVVDASHMRSAIDNTKRLLSELDDKLDQSNGPWLFGAAFTLADLFWAVSLYRFVWLGYSGLWTTERHLKHVEAYAGRLFHRPSVRNTIIDWPGHPPSEYVDYLKVH
jgi:2,5-dichlorohydroquinone reductive dechlorinase